MSPVCGFTHLQGITISVYYQIRISALLLCCLATSCTQGVNVLNRGDWLQLILSETDTAVCAFLFPGNRQTHAHTHTHTHSKNDT